MLLVRDEGGCALMDGDLVVAKTDTAEGMREWIDEALHTLEMEKRDLFNRLAEIDNELHQLETCWEGTRDGR